MECKACGYKESKVFFDGEEMVEIDHDQEPVNRFIKINGNFTMERQMNYGTGIEPVKLYACPECYTVIMERW